MWRLTRVALTVLWATACIAVLVWWFPNRNAEEAHQALGWMMILLNLPISVLVTMVFGSLSFATHSWIGGDLGNHQLQTSLYWLSMVVGGILQWFWLVPMLLRKLGSLRARGQAR